MREGNLKPNSKVPINLNVSAESFDLVLNWLYTGNINLQLKNIGEILHIAKSLEIDHLWEYCEEAVKVLRDNSGDAVTLYKYAAERNMTEMAGEAATLAAATFKDVVNNGRYLSYTFEQFALLLSLDNINADSELEIFNAIRNWVLYSWDKRKVYRHHLIHYVNFLNMTIDEICNLSEELINISFGEENPITWGEDGYVIDGLIRGLLKLCSERCQYKVRRKKMYGQNEAAVMIQKFFNDEEKQKMAWHHKIAEQQRARRLKLKMERNAAATRIQSVFRGFRARKQLADMHKSAAIIQNYFRDYSARRQQKQRSSKNRTHRQQKDSRRVGILR